MLSESLVRDYLSQARENLEGWSEQGGHLLPTEPDPKERVRIRLQLRAVIFAYQRVLNEAPVQLPPCLGCSDCREGA